MPGHRHLLDQKIADAYRCLQNTGYPAVRAYMKAQAAATEKVLARIPRRERLLKRIQDIDAEVPATVVEVNREQKGHLFYEKRLASDNQFKLCMRHGFGGPEKLLVDPDAMARATGKPHATGAYNNSSDGTHVACSVSAGGAEIGTPASGLRLRSARTAKTALEGKPDRRSSAAQLPFRRATFRGHSPAIAAPRIDRRDRPESV